MQPVPILRSALRPILDFALPPRCPGCGVIVDDVHRFCLGCWQSLIFLGSPCCRRCGLPFEYDAGEGAECGACLAHPPAFDSLRAAVAYGNVARAVVLKLKYGGRPAVAATCAHFMRRHLGESEGALLVPVPLHRWRIWSRGYNQSALIARALSRGGHGCEAALDIIERVKRTPPLRGMSRSERARTVAGAFALSSNSRERVKGRAIILVDDVYTTGATADACARLLRRAGAASVNILCWARVVRTDDD